MRCLVEVAHMLNSNIRVNEQTRTNRLNVNTIERYLWPACEVKNRNLVLCVIYVTEGSFFFFQIACSTNNFRQVICEVVRFCNI